MPGPLPMKSFLAAAATRGVSSSAIEQAAAAYAEFERVVRLHAGDRASFTSMALGATGNTTRALDLQHKRAAYRANRHLWGVHSDVQLATLILRPATDSPEHDFDIVKLRGVFGWRRERSERPLYVLSGTGIPGKVSGDDDATQDATGKGKGTSPATHPDTTHPDTEPIEEPVHGVPLLKAYCSQPLPEMRRQELGAKRYRTELVTPGIGKESEVSYVTGELVRNVPGSREQPTPVYEITLRVPARTLLIDLLFDEDHLRPESVDCAIYVDRCRHLAALGGPFTAADRLPMGESVVFLGRGTGVLATPVLPSYVEMVEHAMARIGWEGSRFVAYRCKVEYPMVQTTLELLAHLGPRNP